MSEFSDMRHQPQKPRCGAAQAVPKLTSADHSAECELCEAARFTHWYYEDDVCWVADCEVCAVPMVVWKPHGVSPSAAEVRHMLERLTAAAVDRFGSADNIILDGDRRSIPDHWHTHARDADWFAERFRRPMSRYTGVGTPRTEP